MDEKLIVDEKLVAEDRIIEEKTETSFLRWQFDYFPYILYGILASVIIMLLLTLVDYSGIIVNRLSDSYHNMVQQEEESHQNTPQETESPTNTKTDGDEEQLISEFDPGPRGNMLSLFSIICRVVGAIAIFAGTVSFSTGIVNEDREKIASSLKLILIGGLFIISTVLLRAVS